jgi:chorismate mutase
MPVKAVRGAIQLTEDSAEAMTEAVGSLVHAALERNAILECDIVSVIFSQTPDLRSENPARALRRVGFSETPLFCTSEPAYPDSLPRTLRILITFEQSTPAPVEPVYLGGARALRPDITGAGP